MLRSLILQLSRQSQAAFNALQKLRWKPTNDSGMPRQYTSRGPSTELLLQTLHEIVDQHSHAYIVLDGLDECSGREAILAYVSEIASYTSSSVSLFVTSRDERDIENCFENLQGTQIPIHGADLNNDIRILV